MWDPDGAGPATALVVMAGRFTFAGRVAASKIAAWDPATGTWTAFGAGMNSDVLAVLTLSNGDLIAAGAFATAGNVTANFIARWDGNAWSPIGAGM